VPLTPVEDSASSVSRIHFSHGIKTPICCLLHASHRAQISLSCRRETIRSNPFAQITALATVASVCLVCDLRSTVKVNTVVSGQGRYSNQATAGRLFSWQGRREFPLKAVIYLTTAQFGARGRFSCLCPFRAEASQAELERAGGWPQLASVRTGWHGVRFCACPIPTDM
jgi:hypothetical protein